MVELMANGGLLAELQGLVSQQLAPDQVLVSQCTVRNALTRFLEGKIEVTELVQWANLLEAYDQVAYESGVERRLANFVFRLASPEINEPIDKAVCRRMLLELGD